MVLSELLDSYNKLRKRRYSLSDRLVEANKYGYVPYAIPDKEFEVAGPIIFKMADTLEAGGIVEKGSPEAQEPYTPYPTSRQRVGWKDSVGKNQSETIPHVVGYIRSKQEEFKDGLPTSTKNKTDFGKPGAFGPLVPPVTFAPDALAENADKATDKWGIDRQKGGNVKVGAKTSAEDDLKRLNTQLQNRGSGPINDILKSVYVGLGEEDGMWADDTMLNRSVREMTKGLEALNEVLLNNDPDDDCMDLSKLTAGQKEQLGNFKTRGSNKGAALWWDGDSIMADRAVNDMPGDRESSVYGVKLFGHNTAMYRMAKALGTKTDCAAKEEGPIIPHGEGSLREEISVGSTVIGDANESLSIIAGIMRKMSQGLKLSTEQSSKFSSVVEQVVRKIMGSNTARVINYLENELLHGVKGEEVMEHPYFSHIKEEVEDLQERHPELQLESGNQVILLYIAEEMVKRNGFVNLWGEEADFTKRSSGKGAVGVTTTTGPNGEVGLAHKRTADITVLKDERAVQILNACIPEGMEHLRVGGEPFPGEEDQLGISQKTGKNNPSDSTQMGSLNLATMMDAHKQLGLLKTRMKTMRTQAEESRRLGLDEWDIPDEKMDEFEEFASDEIANEIGELTMLQGALDDPSLTSQRALTQTLRREMGQGDYDRVQRLYDQKEDTKKFIDAKKEFMDNPSKANETMMIQTKNELMRNWMMNRRAARAKEDPRMGSKYLALQILNTGSSTSNQLIEENKGGRISYASENVMFGHQFNLAISEDPSVRTEAVKGRGHGVNLKQWNSSMRPDGKPLHQHTIRKHKKTPGAPHAIIGVTSSSGATMKAVGMRSAEDILRQIGAMEIQEHMQSMLRIMKEIGGVKLEELFK